MTIDDLVKRNIKDSIINRGLLDEIIEKLIDERVFNIAYNKTREFSEYDNWVDESIELSNKIVKLLGSDQKFFNRYEELLSFRESELINNTYSQGFKDGVNLLKELLYMKGN